LTELRQLTDFEQILIGLIVGSPRSGYDLKRFFATTPAIVYEPSSGTLYPALQRLEKRGLLSSELGVSAGKREQRRYLPTDAGYEAHLRWLRQPVDPVTIGRDLGTHLMRFVMAEGQLTATETLIYLRSLGQALDAFVADMEVFLRDIPRSGRHPPLAIEHGLAVHRASSKWVREAIIALMKDGSSLPRWIGK
jgi:DNA-binding PadR family transcriptional regulator